MEKLNTNYTFQFEDETETEMTLTYYRIYMLKGKNKKAYDTYNKIMVEGIKDELDELQILYTAYLCADFDRPETMSFEEFMKKCGADRNAVRTAINALTSSKKNTVSETHSEM